MIEILGTYCINSRVSDTIKAVTGESISHLSVLYKSEWVLQANHRGIHAESYKRFLRNNQVVCSIPVDISDNEVYDRFSKFEFQPYDIAGMLFNVIPLECRRLGLPVPKVNLWNSTGMKFCVEFVSYMVGHEESLMTPYQFIQQLRSK